MAANAPKRNTVREEDGVAEGVPSAIFLTCQDCGREVPANNLTIHQLRACPGRARRPVQSQLQGQSWTVTNIDEGPQPMEVDEDDDMEESQTASSSAETKKPPPRPDPIVVDGNDDDDDDEIVILPENPSMPAAARTRDDDVMSTPQGGLRRRRRREASFPSRTNPTSSSSSLDDPQRESIHTTTTNDNVEVVDLVGPDTPEPSQGQQQSAEPPEESNQWACPQCTLFNSKTATRCEACLFPNPERPPDPTRRERLIDDNPRSPLAYVSGGALMGGILGAAGSFLQGGDPISGAAEGAMTGGIGGAFLNGVLTTANTSPPGRRRSERLNLSQARASASITGGYPSLGENSSTNRMRPRSSIRVVTESGPDGSTTTVVMGGTASTRIRRSRRISSQQQQQQMLNDQMMSLLMHSYLENGGGMGPRFRQVGPRPPNIDGMTYEQLIAAFGDGTENMGATPAQIQQLPTKTISDPEKELPEDARQCLICLEDFAAGETRMILPCLHGFHAGCCQKWLETNGSCPICKHRIQ